MIADGVTLDASDGYTPEEKENPDERPTPIPVNPDGISEEPKSYPHWVCWRFEWKDDRGEWSKPPINPETGEYGKSNDPSTAASFQEALAYHERDDTDTDGLGFIVTQSPFAGVDGDAVHDPKTGTFTDDGETLLEQIDAPIEISPSGRGIRALLIGDLPAGGRKGDPVEMYESGRYLTITGQRIPETADEIPPRDRGEDILADVHRTFFPDEYTADEDDAEDADDSLADVLDETDAAGDGIEDDDELIEKAKNAKNGDKFTRLWNGSSAGYPSDSEADMALCDMLAFWTGGDADQMDRLFRRSGLMREKWDDDCTAEGATYGEHTIAEAIDETDEYYDPNYTDDAESVDKTTIDGNTAWTYVRQQYADAGAKRGRSLATEALEDRTAWMHVLEEDRLWVYDHDRGIFHKWGEEIATGMLESGLGDEFSRSERNEIVARLEARNQVHREELNSGEHPEPLVCVGNGVVDLETGELLDHDPSYRFTRGLKWDYDPENADPEPVRSFLDEITRRPEDRDTILDHLAHGIMPTHPYRAFVITYGEGANGKTQLQDLIEGFVGSENAAGVSLDALTGGDDFATGALPGAFVNIGDDEGTGEIRDTAMLKSLTGGGTRRANAKREKQFEFKNKAAMFFSANEPPRIAEEKPAINSRIYPIELPYQFKSDGEYDPENPLHKRKVPQIAKTLTADEDAMEGLLALVVEHAKRLIETDGEYSMPEGPDERRTIYDAASDPIARFVVRCLEQGTEDDMIAKDDVYAVYTALCRAEDERMTDLDKFKKAFAKKSTIDVGTARPRNLTPSSGRDNAWTHLRFTEEARPFMSERLIERYFGDADADADESTNETLADRATAIIDLEHGDGNPYRTLTASVKKVEHPPENGPAAAGVLEDTTGKIDYVAWDNSEAAETLSEPGIEGTNLLIEDARISSDGDGNDVIDIEHAEIRPAGAGVGHLPMESAGANETLADGSGERDDDSPVPDDAEGIGADAQRVAHLAAENPHGGVAKADLAGRAADTYEMDPDRALTAIEHGVDRGLLMTDGDDVEPV